MDASLSSTLGTFNASVKSVGTAVTLASVGFYLHRRGFVVAEGKRTLALISQQVTFPLFLFTKIIYCNQDWSNEPCPNITDSLSKVWILVFWPIYVVSCGIFVGYCVALIAKTPKRQIQAVLAACGFGNSTGLPITLLTVVHANFPSTTDLGKIDPTLFLSVYLLLYPVLQWGMGGWLLSPEEEQTTTKNYTKIKDKQQQQQDSKTIEDGNNPNNDDDDDNNEQAAVVVKVNLTNGSFGSSAAASGGGGDGTSSGSQVQPVRKSSIRKNVLNNKKKEQWYKHSRRGIGETDASLYISDADLFSLATRYEFMEKNPQQFSPGGTPITPKAMSVCSPAHSLRGGSSPLFQPLSYQYPKTNHTQPNAMMMGPPALPFTATTNGSSNRNSERQQPPSSPSEPYVHRITERGEKGEGEATPLLLGSPKLPITTTPYGGCNGNNNHYDDDVSSEGSDSFSAADYEEYSICETLQKIANRSLQPPVIGAIMGLIVAATPLRGIFVDLVDRGSHAPLQWMFDGLYAVGQTAVPINMMIMGCNLSASQQARSITSNSANNSNSNLLPFKTMIAIVIGKMLIMPIIGVITTIFLREYVLNVHDEIAGSFYLVMMIVFITPTANNVMVMVELSGSNTKEGIASVIALQYAFAPILLSLTMSIAIGFATQWS